MGLGRGFESPKGSKRPLEEKEAQMEAEPPKRACTDNTKSEMEEFFALLERIEASERLQRSRKGSSSQKRMVTCEPLWRPAFVWEDFGSGNRTRDGESKPEEENNKEEIVPENKNDDDDNNKNTYDFLNPRSSPSSDPNDEDCGIQRLDLNVPSTGMQIFF